MHRLLIVDDHPEYLEPLALLFGMHGVPAKVVDGGPAALAELARHRPDVLLLDVMMPDMDGFAVLAAVRADRRYDRLAVVMYSALADADTRERGRRMGAQGHVAKGGGFDPVHAMVRQFLPTA